MSECGHLSKDVIELWKKDFAMITGKEEIKIISGELHCDLYRAIRSDIEKAIDDYNVDIQIIAGPIISVENGNKTNVALDLAEKGLIRLWISPIRQPYHCRVFGNRLAYEEEYHEALDVERPGDYQNDPLFVSRLSLEFDQLREALEMPDISNSGSFVKESKDVMLKIKESCPENFDFLTADEFREKAKAFH